MHTDNSLSKQGNCDAQTNSPSPESPIPTASPPAGQDAQQHALLNSTEAADYLRLSRSCLAKWRCAGGGPEYILAGRKVLYARAVLEAWLASRSRRNTSARS
jgi:hypothetical protein